MQQTREIKDIQNCKNVRYRKISMSGSAVAAVSLPSSSDKIKPRQLYLQFPKNTDPQENSLNLKIIQQDYYRKYKVESGIKSLLRAYDQSRKKNSSECMNKLGLDIIKIKSFSNNRNNFSTSNVMRKKPTDKNSNKHFQLKYVNNRELLSPIKGNSAREYKGPTRDNDDTQHDDIKHFNDLTSSLGNFSPEKGEQQQVFHKRDIQKVSKTIFRRERKAEEYLYKRLEGTEKNTKEQQNQIYDKRIKSYLQFLWKIMFAHNIYIDLDIKSDELNNRPRKFKAYIAPGNNGAMVRGLLKRRFWWNLVDERTQDCDFVWTQIKINQIFDKQTKTLIRKPKLNGEWDDEMPTKQSKSTHKFRASKIKYAETQSYNSKLMNEQDVQLYSKYRKRYQNSDKERDYQFKAEKVPKILEMLPAGRTHHVVHNHLIHNFYLGNKKALFHNLKEYYGLIKQDVYNYLPLTFHIRKGLKDPEYIKFLDYYKKRAKQCLKQQKQQEQEGKSNKNKVRNIWIVKPGQNSNQGRGITVIDQVYQLNSILKQGAPRSASPNPCTVQPLQPEKKQQTEKTYIVQMYIDRPMLYNNRKFDIRHYMLITNFYGVTRAYWYEQGYIRTSSYQFDIATFEEEIHLTNDAVQKRYPDYHKYQPYNKVSYEEFQRYLDITFGGKKYNFKAQILPQMKQMATDAAKSVYTKIAPRNQMNNFQIFGLDFMIDRHFKPWLIEINTNPCLQCACPLLNRIIPYMVQQSFKLSLDLSYPPPTHYPNTCKHLAPLISLDTFKYELIFDSQTEGEALQNLYRKVKSNLIEQIGQIEDDEQFKDEGKQCKLDDFT